MIVYAFATQGEAWWFMLSSLDLIVSGMVCVDALRQTISMIQKNYDHTYASWKRRLCDILAFSGLGPMLAATMSLLMLAHRKKDVDAKVAIEKQLRE